ncbi:MAG: hypothetical protein ACLGI6_23945, partial [Gammaproteobacteria bacterium]
MPPVAEQTSSAAETEALGAALARELNQVGVSTRELADGLVIEPSGARHGASWTAYADHR